MGKFKVDECVYCGGKNGKLVFESDGDSYVVRHENPFMCIIHLRKILSEVNTRTAGQIVLGGK